MNWWPDTTLYDTCCGERPCVYKGGRIIYGKMEPLYITECYKCGAEASAPDPLDCMIKWNKMMRGIKDVH
jgi:hypothetical protein